MDRYPPLYFALRPSRLLCGYSAISPEPELHALQQDHAARTEHFANVIEPFAGPVLTTTLPPPNAPQRILYPFTIQFTGTDGFIDQTESLTLTATITVNGKTYSSSAPLVLTQIRPGVAAMWPTPRAPLNKVLSWWNETPQIW